MHTETKEYISKSLENTKNAVDSQIKYTSLIVESIKYEVARTKTKVMKNLVYAGFAAISGAAAIGTNACIPKYEVGVSTESKNRIETEFTPTTETEYLISPWKPDLMDPTPTYDLPAWTVTLSTPTTIPQSLESNVQSDDPGIAQTGWDRSFIRLEGEEEPCTDQAFQAALRNNHLFRKSILGSNGITARFLKVTNFAEILNHNQRSSLRRSNSFFAFLNLFDPIEIIEAQVVYRNKNDEISIRRRIRISDLPTDQREGIINAHEPVGEIEIVTQDGTRKRVTVICVCGNIVEIEEKVTPTPTQVIVPTPTQVPPPAPPPPEVRPTITPQPPPATPTIRPTITPQNNPLTPEPVSPTQNPVRGTATPSS